MTTFDDFKSRTKMRHDFSDQIQVQYQHPDGQTFDTWVSGDEVFTRLRSIYAEEKIKFIKHYDWKKIVEMKESLPEKSRDSLERRLRDRLADEMDDFVGESLLGDSLVSAIVGDSGRSNQKDAETEDSTWKKFLEVNIFREKAVELAWIQLEGSLPESQSSNDFDDWT